MFRPRVATLLIVAFLKALLTIPVSWADGVSRHIEQPVEKSIITRQAVQVAEEQWRAEREKLMARFETLESDVAQLKDRQEQLIQSTEATNQRITGKSRQLAAMEQIGNGIAPLIEEIIQVLDDDIASGLPFLIEERRKRSDRLREVYQAPDVTVSEKFRKAMEALMIEAEYGNTIEVYQEDISIEGKTTLVNIFRLGRMCLMFQTLDHKLCGRFNVATRSWEPLPHEFNEAIQTAIEIGARRQPVELLSLPVGRLAIQ